MDKYTPEFVANELLSTQGKESALLAGKRMLKNDVPARNAFWNEVIEQIKLQAKEQKKAKGK